MNKSIAIFLFTVFFTSTAHAQIQHDQAAFVRGGYIFTTHSGGDSDQASSPLAAVGYRTAPLLRGRHAFSIETEAVYTRDSTDTFQPFTFTNWTITGVAALRWEYETGSIVNPYISAGLGPNYRELKVSDGVMKNKNGEWAFGYSGRAGLTARLTTDITVEAGYRYLGATQNPTSGLHAAEFGLNFTF